MSTIKDVAKLAGVAPSTVSKVLNNYTNVSEEIKVRVLKSVNDLNYIPNQVAASLSSKSKNRAGLLINVNNQRQSIDEINMQYLLGSTAATRENNIESITIFSTLIKDMNYEELVIYLKSLSLNSLIIFGLNKEDQILHKIINEQILKIVVVDADFVNKSTSCVTVNQYCGQYDVASKLLETEHPKSILYIAGKQNGYVTEMRLAAIRDFCIDNSITLKEVFGDFSEKKAAQITHQYAEYYDAVVCASDLMAIGAQIQLQKDSCYKPVCGFDGISLMGYVGPGIITCVQDFYNIAVVAVEELLNLLQGAESSIKMLDYEITTISYESVII